MAEKADSKLIVQLQGQLDTCSPAEGILLLARQFPQSVCFSTSFSVEDQVITDLICRHHADVSLFTLDTGRLFSETYATWGRTLARYRAAIQPYFPSAEELADFVASHGPDAFYQSSELRLACCHIRKVLPLKKALQGKAVWISGLRAAHSPARNHASVAEWDEANKIIKYYPLLRWTTEEVKDYIQFHQVPYNPLQDAGFVSIGCAPCTRAIQPGEDFRAGRWWWEEASKKECGLHRS